MRAKTTTLTAALVLTLAGGLVAGCSANATEAPTPTTTATAETPAPEASAPEPTEAPAPPAAIGDVITAEQAEALPAGQRAYTMADGTLVVIDDAAPLPEAVRAEMTAPIAELGMQFHGTPNLGKGAVKRAIGEAITATVAHGRAFYVIVSFEADAGTFYVPIARHGGGIFDAVATKDEAIRLAQEQADRINNAERRLGEYIEVVG